MHGNIFFAERPIRRDGGILLKSWVGIQVRLKWCAIDYYLIFRHVQTTDIGQNLLTNLRQPRRIYARNCNYDRPESQPRVRQVVGYLGWVDIDFGHSTTCTHSAWAVGRLAEWAVELGQMMEHPDQSQPNPVLSQSLM